MKVIMGIQLEQRQEVVKDVQDLLSEYGCYIKTRLGVHEANENSCSEKGLILLEFINSSHDMAKELEIKLNKLRHVTVKTMEF